MAKQILMKEILLTCLLITIALMIEANFKLTTRATLKMRLFQTKDKLKNYRNQLSENSRKEKLLNLYRQYLGCRFSRYAIDK